MKILTGDDLRIPKKAILSVLKKGFIRSLEKRIIQKFFNKKHISP
jgi:hypothetical protein